MKTTLTLAMLTCLIGASTVYAQTTNTTTLAAPAEEPKTVSSPNLDPLRVFEGSQLTVRYRDQYNNANVQTHDQGQYIGDIKVTLQLDQEGKLKIKALAETGPDAPKAFNLDSQNLGLGNNTNLEHGLYMKQLYVDYTTGDSHIQAGSLPVAPTGVTGALNIDANGWIDGARYQYTVNDKQNWIRDINVTVGQMNELDSPQIWKREYGTMPNLIQVHVRGDLSKIAKYTVEGTSFEDDQYLRGIVDIAVKDILGFVDQISIEEMIGTGDQLQQGFALSLKKKLKDGIAMSMVYSRKEDLLNKSGGKFLMMEDNYRPGDQLTFKIEKPVNKAGTITPYVRVSKTLNAPNTPNVMVPLNSTAGMRFEVGVKMTLPKATKKVVRRPIN